MKKLNAIVRASLLASVFACAAPIVGAQDVTDPMVNRMDRDDDSGKWGLLGLLGLLGLIGLKRRDHDNHIHTTGGR